jgi:hypothetical protein
VVVVNAENGRTLERDTITCAHCNRIVMVKPGTGCTTYYIPQLIGPPKEEAGAWCAVCNKPVCLTCHADGRCLPLMRRLEMMEAIPLGKRVRKWIGLAVVALAVLVGGPMQSVAQARPSAPLNFQVIAGDVLTGVNVAVTITVPTAGSTFDAGSSGTLATLSGIATSDRPLTSCTWVNSLGGSGTTSGTTAWSVSNIALSFGSNVITVTCTYPGGSGSDVLTVTRTDTIAPSVTVTVPTSSPTFDNGTGSTVALGGVASDNVAVSSCAYSNSLGGSGSTSGTTSWSVASVALSVGSNVITVTCLDTTGNMGSDVITVTRSGAPPSGSNFYVRPDGLDSHTGTTNTAGGAWLTIGKCASTIVAGDTCRVQPGTYSASITETTSGTSGNTITYVADGAVTLNGTFTTTGNYVRIIGFTFVCGGAQACVSTQDSDGIEVWNSTFSGFVEGALVTTGPIVGENDDNLIFLGNTMNGVYGVDNQQVAIYGSHNLAAYNTHNMAGNDYYTFYGPGFRVFNNYAWGPAHTPHNGQHSDFAQTGWCCSRTVGTEGATIEANFYVGNPPGDNQHFSNQETSPDNSGNLLYRRNVIHNNAGGAHGIFNFTTVYIAQETYIDTQVSDPAGTSSILTRFGTFTRVNNSLFQDVWNAVITNAAVHDFDGSPGTSSFNLAWDASIGAAESYCCVFGASATNIKTQQPLFADYANDLFYPTAVSPARNAAGPLTTVSGSGTGTTFTVASGGAGFFRGFDASIAQYGGNLAAGDIITIGTDVRRILSISGNTITVTSSFTWANGDGVYYGNNAIDNAIGAYPYRATYTLTGTYTCNGSTCTVVSSDSTITRMVVCYESNVPYQVVIDAPYVCTDPAGTFEARVYPLYASKTLWAVATDGNLFARHVANKCTFNGNGTAASPCAASAGAAGPYNNLQSALTAAVSGDTVIVYGPESGNSDYVTANGTGYTGAAGFTFGNSGSVGNLITLRNAAGEHPVLRPCVAAETNLTNCNRPTLDAYNKQYIKITSDSCPTSGATSLGLHIYGGVYLYDDTNSSEALMSQGSEISCTEIERGYASFDDGNWAGIFTFGQYGLTLRHNSIHDITYAGMTNTGAQSSTSGVKMFLTSFSTARNNTINHVIPTQAGGFDCKADCVSNQIYENDIRDVSICVRLENQETAGGPYTANGSTGSVVRNNLCVSAAGSVRGAIRLEDGKTTTVSIYNNTFVNFIYGLEEVHGGASVCQGVTHYNNAYYGTTDAHVYLGDGTGTECTFALSNYNIFGTAGSSPRYRYNGTHNALAAYQAASGFDANSTELAEASFLFTNVGSGIYTLQAPSPLNSAGKVGGVVGGAAVDVGAYTDTISCVGHTCG